jgi:PAS domain S-box-containing protein
MSDSLQRSIFAGKDLSQASSQAITEADVLITAALASRPARQPDLAAENQALGTLAQHLMDDPQSLLKTLVRIALNLCRADTVGVSLLETAPNGESLFRWVALAGALEQFEQTTTPGNFSPCSTALTCHQPQLYSHPERYFSYLYHPQFPIVEGLLIPLCVNDRPLGTLWIVSHSGARRFDAEDQRLMMSFGGFAASALHRMQQLHQEAASALRQSEELNQQILDSSDDCIKVLDLEGRILFMSRGGQASLTIQDITPFLNTSWVEFWPEANQQAAMEAINRARAGEVRTLQGYGPTLSGEPKWWDNKISPIRGADGQVERLLCISRDITDRVRVEDERRRIANERQQAQEKLRESQERYRAIVNQAVTGVACTDPSGKLMLVNQKYCDITGYSAAELSQLRMHDITHPEDLPRNVELFNRILAEGTSFEIEKRYIRKDGSIVWVNNSVSAICDREGKPQSVVAIVLDVSDRKRREANAAFLAEITQDFSRLSTPDEIMQAVGAKIGAFLNLPYCHFISIDEARDEIVFLDRWNAENVPRLPDSVRLSEQVSEDFYRFVHAGETVVSNDTQTNPITKAQANASIQAMSFITVPFHKDGEWKYLFSVHDISPREWRSDEIELVRELANLVFPRLERARAEDALRASEAKYRSLFESMDEGFCILQLIFDEEQKPIDYRFIEINPAFEQQTGMKNALGRTIRELVPDIEPFWVDIYGTVALTGKPTRFVDHAESMERWFEAYAFRIDEPHERKVAVLFNDISARQQAQETLQQAHNALRQQANQLEQANEILQSTLEELQITQEELRQQNEKLAIAHELAELERHRYQDLFNFAPDGYVVTDAQGRIKEANQAFAALVAIEQHYLVNTPLAVYISEPDRQAFHNLLYKLHSSSRVQKLHTDELSLQHPRRHPAPVAPIPVAITGTAICDAQAQVVGVRWLIQDITDRKQAEAEREQLLANERHYANQLQGLTTAALAINSALSVEEVLQVITNQAASIIGTHQSVTSMTINQNWVQAINTIYLSEKYAAWRDYNELTDGSGIYACVCHLNRPMRMTQAELEAHPHWKGFGKAADKHPPLRGWLAAPLVGRDGNNIGLIQLSDKYEGEFTLSDESILVQLAQMASVAVENARLYEAEQQARSAAEASREEAQAANRVKDEFLAVLSHELRSPLNPILGWSKLLQSRKLDERKTVQALSTIERNAKLQSELIEDLLDVSRILQGKLSLNVAPVNLASIIRAAMETVRLAAEAKSIQVEASLAPDVGLVSGDSTRLQQVIWNLLSNAVKFTPEGGQVNIRLERLEGRAHITVSDTGQGIAPDFLPYVFDYFRQANAATTRKFGGLGLGLAIVRHLVELHGGTVRAESAGEGQGATFTVRLPLMPTPLKANPDERLPEQSLDLNGIKILVVDDETDSRELVAFLLEEQGAQVTATTSAHEALIALTQAKPDVLLSDIGMPDMDGYMLIQQVRTLAPEQGGQIPAIALTAYAGETNQQQVIAAGFQKHISKPIEPEVLVQAIAQLVRLRSTDTEFPTSEVF